VLTETYCNKLNIQIKQLDDFIQIVRLDLIYISTGVKNHTSSPNTSYLTQANTYLSICSSDAFCLYSLGQKDQDS